MINGLLPSSLPPGSPRSRRHVGFRRYPPALIKCRSPQGGVFLSRVPSAALARVSRPLAGRLRRISLCRLPSLKPQYHLLLNMAVLMKGARSTSPSRPYQDCLERNDEEGKACRASSQYLSCPDKRRLGATWTIGESIRSVFRL